MFFNKKKPVSPSQEAVQADSILFNQQPDPASVSKQEQASQRQEQALANQMFHAARDFNQSKVTAALKEKAFSRKLAIGCLVIAGVAVAAVSGLTPFKEVEPFVLRVDNKTGAVDIVTSIKNKNMSYDEVVNKYWLAEYVRNRESYDWDTIQATFDSTNLLSAANVQAEFRNIYNSPAAPHKILKSNFKVIAKVNAISFVGDMAQVRFEKQTLPTAGQSATPTPPEKYIATIAFQFKDTPMKEADRLINPLGFQVTSYRVDPETAP